MEDVIQPQKHNETHPAVQNVGSLLSTRMIIFHQAIAQRLGLNATDLRCLIFLVEKPLTPSEIAEYSGLTAGALTAAVDRLVQKKLVVRISYPDDRRRIYIQLTPKAVRTIGALYVSLGDAMGELMGTYTPEQRDTIVDFCQRSADILYQETITLKKGK